MPRRIQSCCWMLLALALAQSAAGREEPSVLKLEEKIWSLEPLHKPALPATKTKGWAKSPIDVFILAKLEAKRMHPAQRADKRDLLRRVTFDLTGLPPTPQEMQVFLDDKSPDAFARVA